MDTHLNERLAARLSEIRAAGLAKQERHILGAQAAEIEVADGEVLNFCANNYLGLANDPRLAAAAHEGIDRFGFGLASVRFICGTQTQHRDLEGLIAKWLGYDDAILYSSCFDANGGLFETLFGPEDAIISDALNHASIIDGIRLCKAKRFRYANRDMADLEAKLQEADEAGAEIKVIATDGVFSMDGTIAPLAEICALADRYRALVMIDDCHATGFFGKTGKGTPEHCGVEGRIDILTSTLGKALGGATGGFTCASAEVVEMLRNKSRPYLFSNSIAPPLVAASITCIELLEGSTELRDRLEVGTQRFRAGITAAGFDVTPGEHPIVPIMLGDAKLAATMADELLAEGIYVVGFSFPVVPREQARIRVQISAAHTDEHIDRAIAAFTRVGQRHGLLSKV